MDLKQFLFYLRLFSKAKWMVIVPAAALTVVSALIAWSMPSSYKSQTLILVEKQQIPETYVTPTDRTPFSQRLSTITQQLLSRQNLEKISSDFRLYRDPENLSPMSSILSRFMTLKQPSKEEVIELMTKDIEVKVIGDHRAGDAFSIAYVGSSPEIAMQVTNTLASLFIEENLKAREQYAEGASDFISNELDNAKTELETQERAVRSFKERTMGSLPQQLEANLRTLDRLQAELQSVKNEIKNSEDRKSLLESQLSPTPVAGAVTNPLQTELESLQRELTALLSRYKENYPDVIITRQKISELKAQMAKRRSVAEAPSGPAEDVDPVAYNEILSLKAKTATLNARAAEINKQIQLFERRVESTPESEQKFTDLRRDYDISLRNYQTLLEKKMNAKLAENLEKRQKGERFKIIDSANLPERPFKPNKPVIVAMGTLAGTAIGVFAILFMTFLKPTFRLREELAGAIDMPVLATVPAYASKGSDNGQSGKKRSFNPFKRRQGIA